MAAVTPLKYAKTLPSNPVEGDLWMDRYSNIHAFVGGKWSKISSMSAEDVENVSCETSEEKKIKAARIIYTGDYPPVEPGGKQAASGILWYQPSSGKLWASDGVVWNLHTFDYQTSGPDAELRDILVASSRGVLSPQASYKIVKEALGERAKEVFDTPEHAKEKYDVFADNILSSKGRLDEAETGSSTTYTDISMDLEYFEDRPAYT